VLGPELVVNGDFSSGMAGWTLAGYTTAGTPSGGSVRLSGIAPGTNFNELAHQTLTTVAGRTYKISFPCTLVAGNVDIACYASGSSGWLIDSLPSSGDIYIQATSTTTTLTVYAWNGASTDVPFDVTVGPATAKEVPGNHMLQATSVDRPLLSARTNNFASTEDLNYNGGSVWYNASGDPWTTASKATTGPDGSLVDVITTTAAGTWFSQNPGATGGQIAQAYVKLISGAGGSASIRTLNEIGNTVTLDGTWKLLSVYDPASLGYVAMILPASSSVAIYHPNLNFGSTALPYQRVNTASDYDSTGFPIAQLYDGTDDGMATAAFSAGTLIDGMDYMIAVRRDSAASCVAGLYNGVADATKFFGMAESASGSGCVGSGAGTPTVWVDNTQLTGGTAVTRGTLHTALTGGDWHILEFRNLDLSTWTAAGFGLYTSYLFPGPRGDIMLYPSTASTEDKDAARQWLADYYGVTLA